METKLVAPSLGGCTIDLTENCNLACDYCFTWRKGNCKNRVLKPKIAHRIIDWWLDQGNPDEIKHRNISWWGGEPLVEYELLQKLTLYAEKAAEERGYTIDFGGTTNGMLYTEDKIPWLIDHKCMMLISLDGIEPAHDLHRKTVNGEGSWKIVDKNTRAALKIFPEQKVRFSFAPDTLPYFYENILYFYDMGLRDVAFSPVYEADWNEEAIELFLDQSKKVFEFAIAKHKEGDPIIMKHYNDEAAFCNATELLPSQNPCGAGSSYGGWSYDGFYYPCHRFNKHNQTTKKRMKHEIPIIASIYKGFVNEEFRKTFWNYKNDPPKKCLECSIYRKSGCNGGCYASNYDITGDIKDPAKQLCAFTKAQHEAGSIYNEAAVKEGIQIKSAGGWDGRGQDAPMSVGCICYNMCYNEGTSGEIKHLDYRNDIACMCYQTLYDKQEPEQYSVINHDQERFKEQFIDLTLRIINERQRKVKKSKKQKELEEDVINKTLMMWGIK